MKTEKDKEPEILPTHTPDLFRQAVVRAAEMLGQGEVVALPTETVYGLAANAGDRRAIQRIFEIKGRPQHNPLIVHVEGLEMAKACVREWPESADQLARAFWPGPLTLVLPKSEKIPDEITAGGETVGVRWPSHPFMREVLKACGFPLAAPSANLSTRVSPTTPEHVKRSLGGLVSLIVDGGACQVGIESTVIDLTVKPPAVLRPGMIHEVSLQAVCGGGAALEISGTQEGPLRSPGQLSRHYAPLARLRVMSWKNDEDLARQVAELRMGEAEVFVLAHTRIPSGGGYGRVSVIPHDPEAFARALYGELHACDEAGAGWVVVEALPEGPEWRALTDRLKRAAFR